MMSRLRRVPFYSQISAGFPLTDTDRIGTWLLRVPPFSRAQFAAVRINGDSLIEAGIFDGDVAILRLTPQLQRNGQLAAVFTPEGLTLKHCWFEGHSVRLQSRNRKYRDRRWPVDEITIQGVLYRVERIYE